MNFTILETSQIPLNETWIRLVTSYWHDKKGCYTKKSITFLKRKCKGFNVLEEDLYCCGADEVISRIINLDECSDGIYQIVLVNASRDWYTGHIEYYDYELIKVGEQ